MLRNRKYRYTMMQRSLRAIRLSFVCAFVGACAADGPTGADSSKNNWQAKNSGLESLYIQEMTIDPLNSDVIYASTFEGIFKTSNGSKSWMNANNGMTSKDLQEIECNPLNSRQVYAGSWGDGILMSEDGAGNWRMMNNGITDLRIRSISINPGNPQQLFAAATTLLFQTNSSGSHWEVVKKPTGKVRCMLVDFSNNLIYVGTEYNGISRSNDSGATWEKAQQGLPQDKDGNYLTIVALAFSAASEDFLWAAASGEGVLFSGNRGQSWESRGNDLRGIRLNCMAVDTRQADVIYVGTPQGVYCSEDGSQSWSRMNDGLNNTDVRSIVIDPENSNIIYTGIMGSGVYRYVRN